MGLDQIKNAETPNPKQKQSSKNNEQSHHTAKGTKFAGIAFQKTTYEPRSRVNQSSQLTTIESSDSKGELAIMAMKVQEQP